MDISFLVGGGSLPEKQKEKGLTSAKNNSTRVDITETNQPTNLQLNETSKSYLN